MMFRDNSTNGTMINNIMVRKRAVPIRYGDSIMIAGQYPLNWSQINSFFPDIQQDARRNIGSSVAVPYTPEPPANNVVYTPAPAVNSGAGTTEVRLNGWNWGAFLFGGWWGLFNGCWWIFLVNIILGLLSLIPFAVAIFGPVQIIWSIICGVKGDQWAWENKEWYSAESFRTTPVRVRVSGQAAARRSGSGISRNIRSTASGNLSRRQKREARDSPLFPCRKY